MITYHIGTNKSYQQRCRCWLQQYFKNLKSFLASTRRIIHRVFSADLSHVDKIMSDNYSKFGPAPRPASCMLRSMLLSILHKTTSITKWVDTMRAQTLFALISGFSPNDVPGVGTFYDFIARLWNSDSKNLSPHIHCKKML